MKKYGVPLTCRHTADEQRRADRLAAVHEHLTGRAKPSLNVFVVERLAVDITLQKESDNEAQNATARNAEWLGVFFESFSKNRSHGTNIP